MFYGVSMKITSESVAPNSSLIPMERVERLILLIRGQKVILDRDLALLYEVPTKVLVQAVKRNVERFPEDFMFRLDREEARILKSQIVTSSSDYGGISHLPYVFTEQGFAMLSSVLRSKRAVQVNIEIMRAFVRLRQLIGSHEELSRKLDVLEKKYADHDEKIAVVFDAIRQLMEPPPSKKKRKIGFRLDE